MYILDLETHSKSARNRLSGTRTAGRRPVALTMRVRRRRPVRLSVTRVNPSAANRFPSSVATRSDVRHSRHHRSIPMRKQFRKPILIHELARERLFLLLGSEWNARCIDLAMVLFVFSLRREKVLRLSPNKNVKHRKWVQFNTYGQRCKQGGD